MVREGGKCEEGGEEGGETSERPCPCLSSSSRNMILTFQLQLFGRNFNSEVSGNTTCNWKNKRWELWPVGLCSPSCRAADTERCHIYRCEDPKDTTSPFTAQQYPSPPYITKTEHHRVDLNRGTQDRLCTHTEYLRLSESLSVN